MQLVDRPNYGPLAVYRGGWILQVTKMDMDSKYFKTRLTCMKGRHYREATEKIRIERVRSAFIFSQAFLLDGETGTNNIGANFPRGFEHES